MRNNFTVGNRKIGPGNPTFIIAEISGNHNQSYKKAIQIIDGAISAGVDAIKMQTYTADTITIDSDKKWFKITDGPWKGQNLYQLYKKAHTPWSWQAKLKNYVEKKGVMFFSSAFDESSVDFLQKLKVNLYKVASFEIVDIGLLEKIGKTRKPVIISRGMASLDEIKRAMDTLYKNGTPKIAILHCVSDYPADPKDMNLCTIPDLAKRFRVVVGLSDHTLGITTSITAVALGASIIEKHVTLDRSEGGSDAAFSLEPRELKELVTAIREVEQSFGKPEYSAGKNELKNKIFRRSLFVVKDMKKGDKITKGNVRSIRPGYGLETKYLKEVLGKPVLKNIEKGTPFSWKMINSMNKKIISKKYLEFRTATIKDADILLRWRNDPETRKWSHNVGMVKKNEHIKWLTDSLKNSNRKIYIVEYKKHPVGTIRTDEKDGITELSWTVAPEARGRGIGKKMIFLFANQINGPIKAEVKVGNVNSRHITEYLGMVLVEEKNGVLHFIR